MKVGLGRDAGSTLYQYPYSKKLGPFDLIQSYRRLCSHKGLLSFKIHVVVVACNKHGPPEQESAI